MLTTKMYEHRRALKLNQQELADIVGCRRETIGKLENGKYNPSLRLAMSIASVFGVQVEDLFSFDDLPEKLER